MCNPYNVSTTQQIMIEWTRAMRDVIGNLKPSLDVYPNYPAPVVRNAPDGVRKIGATRAAEAGATVAELEALFGWMGGTMASHYTRTADRKRLAKSAAEKIGNAQRPHPYGQTPRTLKKAQ